MSTVDPTEDIRRELIPTMPAEAAERQAAGEPVWTTEQMRALFEVEGFAAPYVLVRERATGKQGTLCFTHSPRYYFDWTPSW